MDLVARLIKSVGFILLVVFSSSAMCYGGVDQGTQTLYKWQEVPGPNGSAFIFSSPVTACLDAVSYYNKAYNTSTITFNRLNDTNSQCYMDDKGKPWYSVGIDKQNVTGCPPNSTLVNSKCECSQGFNPGADGQCKPYTCPVSGSYEAITTPDVKVGNVGDLICGGGCERRPTGYKTDVNGTIWATWPYVSTGKTCGGAVAPQTGISTGDSGNSPAPTPCGANKCPGTINGTSVCVACASQTSPGPSTSASGVTPSNPAPPSSSGSPDPSKTISGSNSSTTCLGASCTTTTNYQNSSGQTIGQDTKTEPKDDYCQKNPKAQQCKGDDFGGSCAAGFTCDGDAVQCALAKEVHVRNCQWFKEVDPKLINAGNAAVSAGSRPSDHPANSANEASMDFASGIDQTDRLAAGCPADVVIGRVGVIPLASHCAELQMLGNLAVAVCLLAAAFIVFKE